MQVPRTNNFSQQAYDGSFGELSKQAQAYWHDAWQRAVLTLDVLRQRGNDYLTRLNYESPNVLRFAYEIIVCGRDLPQPVNYDLYRILPMDGIPVDPEKRPFVIFDPRAGQGPGIGGMKHDSEIGIALNMGHPCYFVSFLPRPVPGQTIMDVCRAEEMFVSCVREMHPLAPKPCLIGNCQAGWQIALTNALNPDLAGALILAGAPLSYWAGERGKSPARYSAGLSGGSWSVALANDLGNGIFDGAILVQNFETLHPANTYWKKLYNLYTAIDTETSRFLAFERWWGSPTLMNGKEMSFITDELFVGNKLCKDSLRTPSGKHIDLRNIKVPIIVLCSVADEITSPQQALGWILDLYCSDDDLVACGQTIVYARHQTAGHLGIFVANAVLAKEHNKFIHSIDMLEIMPPGLYEASFTPKDNATANPDLASGNYVVRFNRRTLSDLRDQIGVNSPEDDQRFEAVARLSENLEGMYNSLLSPIVRTCTTEQSAAFMRQINPVRMQFQWFSDMNPWVKAITTTAENIRANRKTIEGSNIFWTMQEIVSDQIIATFNAYQSFRDMWVEEFFLQFYGNPYLQASLGLKTTLPAMPKHYGCDLAQMREINKNKEQILSQVSEGGLTEAFARAIIYVCNGANGYDERCYRLLHKIEQESLFFPLQSPEEYRAIAKQQCVLLMLDEERAIQALPSLFLSDETPSKTAIEMMTLVRNLIGAQGESSDEEQRRLNRLEKLLMLTHMHLARKNKSKKQKKA